MPKGKGGYSPGQKKIARVAPPRNKITGADFAALRKNGKKKGKKKPTSDPRSPLDEFKPEKKEYIRQLPIPGLIYPLAKNNKKKQDFFKKDNNNVV